MGQQIINVGSSANDGTGDLLRNSQIKANANFTELYATKLESVVAGTNVTIDNTDPLNPIISASGGGGGGTSFKGDWDAETNTPTLANGVGTTGDEYRVSVSGYILGDIYLVDDFIIYDGSNWIKSRNNNQDLAKNFPLFYYNTNYGVGVQNLGEYDYNENAGTTNHAAATDSYPQFGGLASYENGRLLITQAVANATTNIKNSNWSRLQTNQGFYLRFAIINGDASTNSASRLLHGMFSGTSNLGNIDPSTTASNAFGIAADSGDTNIHILARTASTTVAKIDTTWPKANLDRIDCQFYREVGSSKLFYIIYNVTLGQTIKGVISYNPASATFSKFHFKGSGANAIASGFHHLFTKLNTSI